jgi:hypothetical protein
MPPGTNEQRELIPAGLMKKRTAKRKSECGLWLVRDLTDMPPGTNEQRELTLTIYNSLPPLHIVSIKYP